MKKQRKYFFFVLIFTVIICSSSIEAQQGKVIFDSISSTSLEGNLLKDPFVKPMTIYLPPSYEDGDTRYPVIYYLHGFPGNNNAWVSNYSINNAMNSLISQGEVQEIIIVMPNAFNLYGGSWYANSSVAGNYEDYITRDLVKFIDGKYRTLPQRESRAIGGGSMGGHGAMKLAIKHPDVYCAVVSHSGLLSLNNWKDSVCLNPDWDFFGFFPYHAMAIAFSPNPNNPLLYDYPADKNGNLVEDVWQRWLGHDPLTLAKKYPENLKQLAGIYFDHGRSDDTVNVKDSRDLDSALTDMGIPHVYEEYDGGHFNQWPLRLYTALPFLSNLLRPEVRVNIKSSGKLTTTWGQIKNPVQ